MKPGGFRISQRIRSHRTEIADRIADAVRRALPEYRAFPRALVASAVGIDLDLFAELLAADRAPTAADAQRSLDVARARAQAGISVAVFLDSLNVARREALRLVDEMATEVRVSPRERRRVEHALADWIGMLMVQAARAFLEISRGESGAERQRAALLRSLLAGELDADVRGRAALFGLRPEGRYRAFAARPGRAETPADLAYAVAKSGSRGSESSVVAEIGDRVVGLVIDRPGLSTPDAVLGLGPPVPLGDLSHSYAQASRALAGAIVAGRSGIVTLGDVALESAMLEDPARSDDLVARYVAPLGRDASAERILETVESWLEHGASVQAVADRLDVHPNTVRYRLQVYRDRTGEELDGFEMRCAAWWALRWWRVRQEEARGMPQPETIPRSTASS